MDFLNQKEDFVELKLKNDKFIRYFYKNDNLESFTAFDEIVNFIYDYDFDDIDLRLNAILRVLVCEEAKEIISKFGEISLEHIKRLILVHICAKTDNYLSENEKFQKYVDDLNAEILDINMRGFNYDEYLAKIEHYDFLADLTKNKNIFVGIVGFYNDDKFVCDEVAFDFALLNPDLKNLNEIQKKEATKLLDDDEIKKIAKQYLNDENEIENIKNSINSFYETAGLNPVYTINSVSFGTILSFYAKNDFEVAIERILSRASLVIQ